MANHVIDFDGTWFRGSKSDTDPAVLPVGYNWMAMNMLNVGGLLSCRPGYRCVISLPFGKLQGATLFRPRLGIEQIVVVIEGVVYVAPYPFQVFRQLDNVLLSPSAKQIFFALTEQSARRLSTDFDSAIEIVDSRRILFMQDGGITAPAFYDGSQSGHVRDNPFETPVGGPMAWIGDRLWVANGSSVFASDIANPFSFREQIYLGGKTSFTFSGDVTALATTPSLEFPQLLAFTESNTSLLQANIRNRDSWATTDDFQREIFRVGCSSQRSVINHFGQLTWFSNAGIVFFDSAGLSKQTARLPLRDNEMMVSKEAMSEDLSLVAGAAFSQFMLMSVPSTDNFNKQTWVLNNASFQTLTDDSGPSWAGYWLGTRPVEWVYGTIAGAERIYHVSTDQDGENRLWECFRPERLDNNCPITWSLETRGYFGPTSQRKPSGMPCRFNFAEVGLTGLEETLDIGVWFAGGMRGAYKRIMTNRIEVSRGSLDANEVFTAQSDLFAFKPQSRRNRTEEATLLPADTDTGSCIAEDPTIEALDDSFQLLIVGHGPATFRWIKAFASPEREEQYAGQTPCEDESPFSASRYDGVSDKKDTFAQVLTALDTFPEDFFSASKTVTVSAFGLTAVGVGSAESIVSQAAADRAAECIATKQAEFEILRAVPPSLSLGQGDAVV